MNVNKILGKTSGLKLVCCSMLLLLFLMFPARSHAQEMEGTIRFLVTKNWSKMMNAVDYISKQQREKIAYVWGSRSEWKQYTTMSFNATQTIYQDSEERAEPEDEGYSWRKEAYLIKRDFEKNTEFDIIDMLGKTYLIEDTIAPINWKVMNDLKEVAGHLCMNAFWEDTVKKQKITAWFALDIPISGGPERLSGLPGLILQADVNDGAMLISADKIDLKKLTTELDLPKKIKGKKIKEAEYTEILQKHIEQKRKDEEPYFWGMRY